MIQFARQCRVGIGNATQSIKIEGLRMVFDIHKDIDLKPNTATVRIHNLSRERMNDLLSGRYDRVSIDAGYDEMRQLFAGRILRSKVVRHDLDWVIEIEASDGDRDHNEARVNTTLAAGATGTDELAALSWDLESEVDDDALEAWVSPALPRGKVINGLVRDHLARGAQQRNLDVSIQDGKMLALPKGQVLRGDGVLLSQDTGLIGAPEKSDEGLELRCLLNPAMAIGGLVRLKSILDYFNGDYKIVKLGHKGDLLGDTWESTLTVIGGEFQPQPKKGGES